MLKHLGLLRTRVARRVLFLFVMGALVPVAGMALASFQAMSAQLQNQSEERLVQTSRNARQAVMQQLILTESGVRLAAEALVLGGSPQAAPIPASITALAVTREDGRPEQLMGDDFSVPLLLESDRGFLGRGHMVLKITPSTEDPLKAAIALDEPDHILWAVLEGDSIWAAAERFASGPQTHDFCVLAGGTGLYCQSGLQTTVDAYLSVGDTMASAGNVRAQTPDGELIIGHAQIFLDAQFAGGSLRVLVAESMDDLYNVDLRLFRYSFGVALVLGFLTVLLLASVQVRRTMTPLDALTEGTVRLAEGDLSTRVQVRSGDEFALLAQSFNAMASRLGVQFETLEAGRAIDRAALSDMDVDGVADALLQRLGAVVPFSSLAVLVLEHGGKGGAWVDWVQTDGTRTRATVRLSPVDRRWIQESPTYHITDDISRRPGFLVDGDVILGRGALVTLPFLAQGKLLGAIIFEARKGEPPETDAIDRVRQVADQATVALDAISLVAELEEMTWGALRALARAIDAKSKWTAGHSERVTDLSLKLGQAMGLSERDLEILHRGGLLHDVGKIGVPASVLDSPERLTTAEWNVVREHPTIGHRILEPVAAFAPALPIVLQHHERWDGRGYPAGLAGTEIHLLARILAVADTYDAMASPRPYRDALAPEIALAEIRDGAGSQFDARAVEAFLKMMAQEGLEPGPRREKRHG